MKCDAWERTAKDIGDVITIRHGVSGATHPNVRRFYEIRDEMAAMLTERKLKMHDVCSITEEALHEAADDPRLLNPEHIGLSPNALRDFCLGSFWTAENTDRRPASVDPQSVAYGIALGVLAAIRAEEAKTDAAA